MVDILLVIPFISSLYGLRVENRVFYLWTYIVEKFRIESHIKVVIVVGE